MYDTGQGAGGRIDWWDWDNANLAHAARHEVNPAIVAQVKKGLPRFRANIEGRAASHQMIGPDRVSRFWTICIKEVGDGIWRPITGWPSTEQEKT